MLVETSITQVTSKIELPISDQPANNVKSMLDEAMLQDNISNDLIIPREEFTLIDDPDSLEEIVIYDMVVEYQATVTIKKNIDDDIIDIKAEPQEHLSLSHNPK